MPTMTAPSALVVGAPQQPFPFGLLTAIDLRSEGDGRWQNGVTWEPLGCDQLGGIGAPWCDVSAVAGVSEVQRVSQGGSGLTSFTLKYGALAPTASIPAGASAAAVQSALRAVGAPLTGVTVEGADGDYFVTFGGSLANSDVPVMVATPTGGTGTVTVSTTTTSKAPVSAVDTPVTGLPKTLPANGTATGVATPFTIYAHYKCGAMGSWEVAQTRAIDKLIAAEERAVSRRFFAGDLGNVPNLSGANGYPAPVTLAAASVELALARVENGITELIGSQGVIHMGTETASLLKNRLQARGGRMYTLLGTPVAIGAAYPQGMILGTAQLFGYRSEIFTSSNRQGDLLDLANNDLTAIAERTYLIGFDPCPVVKVTFTP